ncbi:stage II sporulation protein R [Neobacillus dielmonensis]|uniref:stage II sporulation protein R n=1 Tax=Neobacillus dielmonensis TaxID=1347369 RepID=UPI0005AB7372|nr:stage II sporulation protein R [Neobacillus dielmonensis]
MNSKIIVWAYLVVLSFATMVNLYMPKTEAAAKESIVIPGEAIRLRILANSDFDEDQRIKRKVRDAVNAQISLWVQDLSSMEKAKTVLQSKLPEIQGIAENVVREQGSDQSVKVEFGKVQFPTKLYGQFLYPAGEYQAILITLGKGEGANWWCVLYPPLCFLDFSNGVAVSDGFEEKKQTAKAKKKQDGSEALAKLVEKQEQQEDEKTKQVEKLTKAPKEKDADKEETEEDKKAETSNKKDTSKEDKPDKSSKDKQDPVYVAEDEQPVKVKFFIVDMWKKIF